VKEYAIPAGDIPLTSGNGIVSFASATQKRSQADVESARSYSF